MIEALPRAIRNRNDIMDNIVQRSLGEGVKNDRHMNKGGSCITYTASVNEETIHVHFYPTKGTIVIDTNDTEERKWVTGQITKKLQKISKSPSIPTSTAYPKPTEETTPPKIITGDYTYIFDKHQHGTTK
jgi:hypothetical protein